MALEILERIETSLVEKRQAVTEFLETASDAEREICLYEDDHCVQDHLHACPSGSQASQSGLRTALSLRSAR